MNIYITPQKSAEGEITEKRSRFIANIKSVSNEQEALEFVKEIKKKYYDAKHNVFAYITDGIKRYNDDGEPSKTGGYPILEMFDAQNITDVVCVVTRYFGGVLLGTGGLVRAYTAAAKLALENAGVKKMMLHDELIITVPYSLLESVKHLAGKSGCEFEDCEYADVVKVRAVCNTENTESLKQAITGTFGINVKIEDGNKVYR